MVAPSFVQSKNEPDIFRCSEYVSSGGGERRCRNMIGMIRWMRLVVSCVWKLNGSSLAKGSPRIITASACALVITCKEAEEEGSFTAVEFKNPFTLKLCTLKNKTKKQNKNKNLRTHKDV